MITDQRSKNNETQQQEEKTLSPGHGMAMSMMSSEPSRLTESPSWMKRAAITWNNEILAKQEESANYWNTEILSQISSLPLDGTLNNDDIGGSKKDTDVVPNYQDSDGSLSYESLLMVTILVTDALRQMISSLIDSSTTVVNDQTMREKYALGIPVAVAIPEGPFLPMAILATHVLGKPFSRQETNNPQSSYAILVPMEPTEGKDRLKHMMIDSQPAIVLCMPGQDMDRVEQQISALNIESTAICIMDDNSQCRDINLGQIRVVDFSQLIVEAIQRYRTESRVTSSKSNAWSHVRSYCIDTTKTCQENFLNEISTFLEIFYQDRQDRAAIKYDYNEQNRISHIVYTSGTTGVPKGCISSVQALKHYLDVKNEAHTISMESIVLLASALSFDPCLSDILATFNVKGTLAVAPRKQLVQDLSSILRSLHVTHILCTPTLWSIVHGVGMAPRDFPSLEVVALGGEPIPKRIVQSWARDQVLEDCADNDMIGLQLRLFATYGVTEACVYQTIGEVFRSDLSNKVAGQDVGLSLPGLFVEILPELGIEGKEKSSNFQELDCVVGEVVLHGAQLDVFSSYLNQPDLTRDKFVERQIQRLDNGGQSAQDTQTNTRYCYRTGDRGYIHKETNHLHIVGRINGEDGMVKINGVRVELGEIENAIRDDHEGKDDNYSVVVDCLASVSSADPQDPDSPKQMQAFCVLSSSCLQDLNLLDESSMPLGVLCTTGPLLELLRGRCMERVKQGCIPSTFTIIQRLPLSPTGKCDKRKLPRVQDCVPLDMLQKRSGNEKALLEYGIAGSVVADIISDCLNLQSCQEIMLTTASSFAMLGGDSLTATRVVRALYAAHNGVLDSRKLGGSFGVLEGPFAVSRLILAKSLGDYVDMLDNHGVCSKKQEQQGEAGKKRPNLREETKRSGADNQITSEEPGPFLPKSSTSDIYEDSDQQHSNRLYEALIKAITLRQSNIAMALLDLGTDPNFGNHGGRLSKADRRERKRQFTSNPLHLACGSGDDQLTKKLIEKGCKFTSPDAAGSYPMLLACSGTNNAASSGVLEDESEKQMRTKNRQEEDTKRKECVRLLLEAGAPLAMKDGNKQTVLHCAARSGHCELLEFLMKEWKEAGDRKEINVYKQLHRGGRFDWADRWFRTPVHWAVLNGNVESLKILLRMGCSANPPKPKTGGSNRQTSLVIESPLEICKRLYGEKDGIGKEMSSILQGSAL